jgi:hypothetical protein
MDENPAPASRSFARWWLGGFGGVCAVVAAALGALFNAGFLASLGFAVLGLIVGLEVGFGVAEVVVLIGEGLEWDDRPEASRVGRITRRMGEVIDGVGL